MSSQTKYRLRHACVAASIVLAAACGASAAAQSLKSSVVHYDASNQTEYLQKWANIYGPLELAAGGTLDVTNQG